MESYIQNHLLLFFLYNGIDTGLIVPRVFGFVLKSTCQEECYLGKLLKASLWYYAPLTFSGKLYFYVVMIPASVLKTDTDSFFVLGEINNAQVWMKISVL